MAATMSRSWVVLLAVFAWQACSAQNPLVNLAEPQLSRVAPSNVERVIRPRGTDAWKLFDHDDSTYADVSDVEFQFSDYHDIEPTHYRITMAAHVDPSDYPRRWRVKRRSRTVWRRFELTGVKFTDGVFEAPLPFYDDIREPTYTRRVRFGFLWRGSSPDTTYAIAEIELLGKRRALNDLWPFGKYPCKQRLAILTSLDGPTGELFYAAKNDRAPEVLRAMFSPAEEVGESSKGYFEYDGIKPVILGAELPERPIVNEVAVFAFRARTNGKAMKFVLEGNMCDPGCDKLGSDGWVKLAETKPKSSGGPSKTEPRLLVETPDMYKAYRVKVFPMKNKADKSLPRASGVYLTGIYFLGCP